MTNTYHSRESADRILQRNFSERYKRLDYLERVADARQYEGRPSFWTADVPLFEKAPVIKSRIIRDAVQDNTALMLGESHYPEITSKQGEDNSKDGEDSKSDDGVSETESEALDDLLEAITNQARLRSHERAMYARAQESATSVALLGVRHKKLFAEVVRAKWCTPAWQTGDTWSANHNGSLTVTPGDGELEQVEIRYPYKKEHKVGRQVLYQVLLFRRVITRSRDVTFLPVEAREDGEEPKPEVWVEDSSRSITHGLGFVPVVWWAFRKTCSEEESVDGVAIHEGIEIEPFDMALSQRHKAALWMLPQRYEIGVPAGYNPTAAAREPVPYTAPGKEVGPPRGYSSQGKVGGAVGRKLGPDWVAQYPEGASVGVTQASGDSLQAISDHCSDLEAKLAQSLAVIFLDPSRIKFAGGLSGRALKLLKLRQLDMVGEHFDDWATHSSQPTLSMLCRIALLKRDELVLPALKPALPLLAKFAAGGTWTFPDLQHIRPPWIDLDPEEEQMAVATTKMAKEAGLCTEIQAVRKVQPVLGGDDPQDTVDAIEEERQARRKEALEDMQSQSKAEADAYHDHAGTSGKDPTGADAA